MKLDDTIINFMVFGQADFDQNRAVEYSEFISEYTSGLAQLIIGSIGNDADVDEALADKYLEELELKISILEKSDSSEQSLIAEFGEWLMEVVEDLPAVVADRLDEKIGLYNSSLVKLHLTKMSEEVALELMDYLDSRADFAQALMMTYIIDELKQRGVVDNIDELIAKYNKKFPDQEDK